MRRVLEAQFAYERMREARSWFAHLLALLGVIIWLEAIWSNLLSSDIRFYTISVFGGVFFLTVHAAIAEIVWRRKLKSCLAARRGNQGSEEVS